MGRPSIFTDELADRICDRVASGMSLFAALDEDGMPAHSTVMGWLAAGNDGDERYKRFLDKFPHARDIRHERMIERCVEEFLPDAIAIADGLKPLSSAEEGESFIDSQDADVQRDRLRADARFKAIDATSKLLAQMAPKKYGTKVTNEHTGKDGGAIITETVTRTMTEAELDARIHELSNKTGKD